MCQPLLLPPHFPARRRIVRWKHYTDIASGVPIGLKVIVPQRAVPRRVGEPFVKTGPLTIGQTFKRSEVRNRFQDPEEGLQRRESQ